MNVNIAKTGYIVSHETLAAMARDYALGVEKVDTVSGSYIRILVAHTQRDLQKAKVKRATQERVCESLAKVHEELYSVVLEAITTADLKHADDLPKDEAQSRATERNRRSNFARSAKSTVLAFVNAGGKLMSLKPSEVTKSGLREQYMETEPPKTPKARLEQRAQAFVTKLAAKDVDEARAFVERLAAQLAGIVEKQEAKPAKAAKRKGAKKARRLVPTGETIRRGELRLTAH